jgi:hypothetical protein
MSHAVRSLDPLTHPSSIAQSILFRFLGFVLWFVLGFESLREAPGGPGEAHGGRSGASRGPPDPPGPGSQKTKILSFCRDIDRMCAASWGNPVHLHPRGPRLWPCCSVASFRFLGLLHWFVLGPGGLREAPGGPGGRREAPGGPGKAHIGILKARKVGFGAKMS